MQIFSTIFRLTPLIDNTRHVVLVHRPLVPTATPLIIWSGHLKVKFVDFTHKKKSEMNTLLKCLATKKQTFRCGTKFIFVSKVHYYCVPNVKTLWALTHDLLWHMSNTMTCVERSKVFFQTIWSLLLVPWLLHFVCLTINLVSFCFFLQMKHSWQFALPSAHSWRCPGQKM